MSRVYHCCLIHVTLPIILTFHYGRFRNRPYRVSPSLSGNRELARTTTKTLLVVPRVKSSISVGFRARARGVASLSGITKRNFKHTSNVAQTTR